MGGWAGGGALCAQCAKQQRRTPGKGALSVPEQVELQRKNGQRSSDHQLQEAGGKKKKDSDRMLTPEAEAIHVPAHLVPPGSPQPKQLCHFHAQSSMGQSCHRQKVFCLCTWGHFGHVQLFETLWTVACQVSLSEGFSRQEYKSVLSNTAFHTLLEHYSYCCPSCQLP